MALQKDIDFGKLNFAVGFNRTSAFPLDANSYFEDYNEAVTAAVGAAEVGSANSAFYIGQIIIVNDKNEKTKKGLGLYQITGTAGKGTLTKFGQATSADELGERLSEVEKSIATINGKLILATHEKDGLLSKEDKQKIDALDTTYVKQVAGKGLSTNDYDKAAVDEVAKIKSKADQTTVDALAEKVNGRSSAYVYANKSDAKYDAAIKAQGSFSVGDTIYFTDPDISDQWVTAVNTEVDSEGSYYSFLNIETEKPDLDGYVPTSRKINKKPLTGDISLTAADVGAATQQDITNATSGLATQNAVDELTAAVDNKASQDDLNAANVKISKLETSVGKAAAGEQDATGLYKAIADEAATRASLANTVNTNTTNIETLQKLVGTGTVAEGEPTLIQKVASLQAEVEKKISGIKVNGEAVSPDTDKIVNITIPVAFITALADDEKNLSVTSGKLSLAKVSTDLLD